MERKVVDNSTSLAISQLREHKITCPNCKKQTPLKEWVFVQTYWYQAPYGPCHMLGGDYEMNKDIEQCLVICPHTCGANDGEVFDLATRIMDLPMCRKEREWVFGLVSQITGLDESKLVLIFDGHYVQYGRGKEIKSSEEIREEREREFDLY